MFHLQKGMTKSRDRGFTLGCHYRMSTVVQITKKYQVVHHLHLIGFWVTAALDFFTCSEKSAHQTTCFGSLQKNQNYILPTKLQG